MSWGFTAAMKSSLKTNAGLLKGKTSFNERRSMYNGALNEIESSSNKESLSKEEINEIRRAVRLRIKKRNRYNTTVLLIGILIALSLVSPIFYWLLRG